MLLIQFQQIIFFPLSQSQCHSSSVLVSKHRTMTFFPLQILSQVSIFSLLLGSPEDRERSFDKSKVTLSVDFRADKIKLTVSLILTDMESLKPLQH